MTRNTITLNVWDDNKQFFKAVEGENSSRKLIVKLVDREGPVNLSEKIVHFLAIKPDGNIIYNTMNIDDAVNGVVSLELTEQICARRGMMENCEIDILDLDNKKLVAKKIDLYISPSICSSVEESLSEITAFNELIKKVNNLETHVADLNNPHNVNFIQTQSVPTSRKINNKPLVDDINLSSSDVNAASINHHHTMNDIDLSGPLPISFGGTGATSTSTARENLGVYTVNTSLSEIISYPCTTAEVLSAIPNKSTLALNITSRSTTITDLPETSGFLTIVKDQLSSSKISFTHLAASSQDSSKIYNGFYRTDIIPVTVSWVDSSASTGTIPISRGGTGATTASGAIANFKSNLIDLIYPVGSYYFSSNSISPSTLFGGTWSQVKDTFILAAGDTYQPGTTGGESTHKLTTNELPNHSHRLCDSDGYYVYGDISMSSGPATGEGLGKSTYRLFTAKNGGDQPHNNMPPYTVAYCWQRTA